MRSAAWARSAIPRRWRGTSSPCGTKTAAQWSSALETMRFSSAGIAAWRRSSRGSIRAHLLVAGSRAPSPRRIRASRSFAPDIQRQFNWPAGQAPGFRGGIYSMILLLASALGAAQAAAAAAPDASPTAEAKAFEQRCAGRQFETAIAREVNGKKRLSRIHLCGEAGQTDAQRAATLKDAIEKIEAVPGFSADSKTQAIEAIKDEIVKAGGKVETAPSPDIGVASTDLPAAPVEYFALPPLPGPAAGVADNRGT